MSPLETWSVTISLVRLSSDVNALEILDELVDGLVNLSPDLGRDLGGHTGGDDDDLDRSHSRRGNETLIVSVSHDHDSDRSSRKTPRVLPDVHRRSGLGGVLDFDVEHLGEVLTETVRRRSLDTSTGRRDKTLDGGGEETTGKLFVHRLDTLHHGHGEKLLVDPSVKIEDLVNFLLRFLTRLEGGVTFLPEELSGSQERF